MIEREKNILSFPWIIIEREVRLGFETRKWERGLKLESFFCLQLSHPFFHFDPPCCKIYISPSFYLSHFLFYLLSHFHSLHYYITIIERVKRDHYSLEKSLTINLLASNLPSSSLFHFFTSIHFVFRWNSQQFFSWDCFKAFVKQSVDDRNKSVLNEEKLMRRWSKWRRKEEERASFVFARKML